MLESLIFVQLENFNLATLCPSSQHELPATVLTTIKLDYPIPKFLPE
jgi:hypothetical protein